MTNLPFRNTAATTFWACVLFAVHFRLTTADRRFDYVDFAPDDEYLGGGIKESPVTPAPTQCPLDDPNDTNDQCKYEDCCTWNKAWCTNSCGNIYDDNAVICHELWVLMKNTCVCNYLGVNSCTDDFRGQLANRDYCANGPDVCDGFDHPPTPSPTPSSTPRPPTSPTVSPTKNSHPCGNDSCQHTCKIFPGK